MLDTVRNRIWAKLHYQCSTTNCSTCKHSSGWSDDNDKGKCNALSGLIFNVLRHGICKLHSAFNGGNIHYGG
jgi:hypothetical protein